MSKLSLKTGFLLAYLLTACTDNSTMLDTAFAELEFQRDRQVIEGFKYGYRCAKGQKTQDECLNKLKKIIEWSPK